MQQYLMNDIANIYTKAAITSIIYDA